MKEVNLNIPLKIVTYDELSDKQKSLVDQAREATYRSYAPYSKFKVGAAISLSNGEVVVGSNQENVAYPSGTCAERSACFYAHARYPEAAFEVIAIAARGTDDEFVENPAAPCGACRQSLLEYETLAKHDVQVILAGKEDIFILPSVKSLLPLAFDEF